MLQHLMDFFSGSHLIALVNADPLWVVAIVAVIILCETGLVIVPFLPGDSLLFTLGAFLPATSLSPVMVIALLTAAAFVGDTLNYHIGKGSVGRFILRRQWLKSQHRAKTETFFQKYGSATVFIGRFVPIVRTLAPFIAGLSAMPRSAFLLWNFAGALAWCSSFIALGYFLGDLAWVRDHREWLALSIIGVSLLPVLTAILRPAQQEEP
ncbi:VTT domain-containing protein [Pantoea rwandensis]|uniref:VTT domain-containing protein n=1 Tax=Pantoea rwandensis TaxID=1076550 RepID=A0A1X1D4F9_9GAMM|nr:VTT domain-containing protein [Pantoea rwandensis]ORM71572.1 hypothetical protein HA51_00365 [Pantoea rwandensis]